MDEKKAVNVEKIPLSQYTLALINNFVAVKKKAPPDDISRVNVSQTVSFFALAYEKIRQAVEYREEHLIRHSAIERILKRRFLMNPEGKNEAENLIRELLWARYFPNGSLDATDIGKVQSHIEIYIALRRSFLTGQTEARRSYYAGFIFDLLTCQIEETLAPEDAKKTALFTYFIYQVLHRKIKIEGVGRSETDAYFLAAIEKAYAKSNNQYLRFHFFNLSFRPFSDIKPHDIPTLISQLPAAFSRVERIVANPFTDRLTKYVKSQLPSFLILFELIRRHAGLESILAVKPRLWGEIDAICREKYQATTNRLRGLAIKSLIYIFLTKMVFALILEYPLSLYFYHEVNIISIIINSVFPPLLMLFLISVVRIPGEQNTHRIFDRVINIVNTDESFETRIAYVLSKPRVKRPVLVFGFTIFYSLTFVITLALIYAILKAINFNFISMIIFVFFVSVVTFFSYRVRQIAKEFKLQDRESFFSPFIDFFFMPILSLGKFLSSEIAKLNFFIVIFDYLIEAPFKFVFEIVEEWISFVRARKDEIV